MDIILISIIAVVIGLAVYAIYRSRKNGVKCIGCPHSKVCEQTNVSETTMHKISIDEIN